ncbi:response regulator transcription factor [Amycolatopsis lurida]|uniref:Transcriptional regulator n=1 Tax=Amycolatopsis lurida NRRL 2430 TaxID=1460371 RepID=A0A2P2FGE4_AMYLU|nr:winged helix-turn-helix domain-containing protein [Amycolatopsis lurida]KFU75791.1 hypothetical protein BB31_39475 [Amycolatopsis lurida NRRL 2430]
MDMILVLSDGVEAGSRAATILQRIYLIDRVMLLKDAKLAISGSKHVGVILNMESAGRERVAATVKELGAARSIPILVLTVHQDETDIVRIFNAGADECLPPTVPGPELLARTRAMVRRQAERPPAEADIVVGALRIKPAARVATLDGCLLKLAGREFDLLLALARRPGHTFDRDDLQKVLWGAHNSGRANVNAYVSRLRRKLGEIAERPRFLHTVYGRGLKLQVSGVGQGGKLGRSGGQKGPFVTSEFSDVNLQPRPPVGS